MKVCIAEKPSVAAEIAKVIGARTRKDGYFEGNGYQVTWSFGHLCRLKSPDEYYPQWKKWEMGVLPMVPPQYEIKLLDDAGVKKQFKIIQTLFKKAECIINCGDAGQEGELIQRWVMELAKIKCPVKRLWISSLTEESIRNGFRALKDQRFYDNLYKAGQARAFGDWLLGMNATRAYTLKYGGFKQVLSVGRVQTPTLSMIVNRDIEIETFQPEPYWVLSTVYRNVTFICTEQKIPSESEGKALLEKVSSNQFTVTSIETKQCRQSSPQLYDLTSLQVDCNKKFGMSAEQTLKTLQSLYEKKYVTYPRVDTKYLPTDMYTKCPDILSGLNAYKHPASSLLTSQLPMSKRVFDDTKITDHHAIIPTGHESSMPNDNEGKVYSLICKRFIAAFYPDCFYDSTVAIGSPCEGIAFKATGKTVISPGWKAVYSQEDISYFEKEPQEKESQALPPFVKGESGSHKPSLDKKMTTPPSRYTDATLLQAMETAGKFVTDESLREALKANGIGRPSSRAGIIETIIKRGYVGRNKKTLISTPSGRSLIETIKSHLLKSPELTGVWEKKLREIESGNYGIDAFLGELETQLSDIINEVKEDSSGKKIQSQPQKTNKNKRI